MSRIIISGGQNLGGRILDYLMGKNEHEIVCVICRADDTGQDSVFPSLMKKALHYKIPVLQPDKINDSDIIRSIKQYDPDLLISALYNQIFRDELIDFFNKKIGIINIHYAPLPKYSGFWPEMWAIWNNEKTFGTTLHYIDRGIDTGKIICQDVFPISETETRKSLYEKCDESAFKMFVDNCDNFLVNKVDAIAQDEKKRTYFYKSLPNNGIVDLTWGKDNIDRFIRATCFYPFVAAKICIGEKMVSIVDKDLDFFKPYFIE